jgi:hypothetical protein
MAAIADRVTVTTSATLLWETVTGIDTAIAPSSQIFRAGSSNQPLPILIENLDAANAVYLGGSGVTTSTGLTLAAGGSLTFNVVGSDSLYAISAGSVVVAVLVGGQ